MVQRLYVPLCPALLVGLPPDVEAFDPRFLEAEKTDSLAQLLQPLSPHGAFAFPFFSLSLCALLDKELAHFDASGLPLSQPNSMHRGGLIAAEAGLTPLVTALRRRLAPLCAKLYPQFAGLDGHHAFAVRYRAGGGEAADRELAFHYDDSHVTLNVCLGREFQGSSLFFCGLLEEPATHGESVDFDHRPGTAVLHLGHHRHGARPITAGERVNLIVWMKSSAVERREAAAAHGHSHEHSHEHSHSHSHDHSHAHGDESCCGEGEELADFEHAQVEDVSVQFQIIE
jgi:hypothetical protein